LLSLQQDHLEKAPQAFVGVHVVDALPIARQVTFEPCTPDDWELIQLHAGAIETELLRQVHWLLRRLGVGRSTEVRCGVADVCGQRQASESDLDQPEHAHPHPSLAAGWNVR
jgi:hypothetical protein